jgi:hypothetical protein
MRPTTPALAVAVALALAGPWVVLVAFGSAGGGDRPRPHVGLLETGVGCLSDTRDYRLHTTTPAPTCPDIPPPGLEAEYRAAWIGLALSLVGSALVLLILGLRPTPGRRVYWLLGAMSGTALLTAALIALASIDLELTSGGSEPDPRDAFDRVSVVLFVEALVLVPIGILVRRLREQPAAGEPVGGN